MNNINSKSRVNNNNYKEENIINSKSRVNKEEYSINKVVPLITPTLSLQPLQIGDNLLSQIPLLDEIPLLQPRTLAIENYTSPSKGKGKRDKLDNNIWKKEVESFLTRVFYYFLGQNLKDTLFLMNFDYEGIEPKIVIATLYAIIAAMRAEDKAPGYCYHTMSATALWTFTSPYKASIYRTNKHVQSFVAATIGKALDALNRQDIIMYDLYELSNGTKVAYTENKPRRIGIKREFMDTYDVVVTQRLLEMLAANEGFSNKDYRKKPAKRGENLNPKTTSETTLKVVDKLKTMQFRFNTNTLSSDVLASLNHIEEDKSRVIDNLAYSLSSINISTDEPQYFPEFHRQDSGRLHTINGAIGLSKQHRKLFIKPLNPDNILVDADLACAQLLILCDLLELPTLKIKLLSLLHQSKDNSIWADIAPNSKIPKAVKKIIVYSFCFGAEIHQLPHIANNKVKAYGIKFKVTSYQVDQVLKGLLSPLVEARDKYINQFTLAKISHNQTPKIATNALGHKFHIFKEAQEYMTQEINPIKNKIGAQLLAFLAQGNEQAIIQPLILNCPYNIVAFQYDGFTYEVAPEEYKDSVNLLTELCPNPLSFEIL